MPEVIYMTKERVREIEEEVRNLKTKGRKEIAQKIAEARSHGDLSENAEYDAAKQDQEMMENRISKMELTLSRVQVISADEMPNDKIYILSKVKLKNKTNGSLIDYMLVSDEEADFEKRKISVTSPIGKALLGKSLGDIAEINVPAGRIQYEILDIYK
ncbi:MAG: transcription elongation factor GreA [Ignavibacteria bacterium GWB2_35_12]|nr:MAG: transcription elongation factor GreA [Ignavibacteria bacterium GWB2_35_12]OGU94558.1 MAG: transcription elongation factor GreA [Ignavibacteria bacterium RIFOXYA2_FULL_35_10]OGV22435.1 MAG: transcription elongation factor GreA [Ignavibacteria bacterium RIFOXYC2_FULL_35_21]